MASETEGGQLGSESAAAAREAVLGREVRSEMRERDEVARNLMPTTVGVSRDDEYYESGHVAREVPHATAAVQAAPPSIGAFSKMAAFVVVVAASMIRWCSKTTRGAVETTLGPVQCALRLLPPRAVQRPTVTTSQHFADFTPLYYYMYLFCICSFFLFD